MVMTDSEILNLMENAKRVAQYHDDLFVAFYTVRSIFRAEAAAIRRKAENGGDITVNDEVDAMYYDLSAHYIEDREDDFCEWYRVAKLKADD